MANKEYIQLLENKFGSAIVESIIENSDLLQLKKGHANDLYVKNLSEHNKDKVKELVSEYPNVVAPEAIEGKEWAFDFPGWIGELNFSSDTIKEIMVIGIEPHIGESRKAEIGNRNFQATYGLRETGKNEFGEIDEYKPNIKLWKNLYAIFEYSKENYRSREFLNRFYITDMAHFAVQGKANEVINIKDWGKIRNEIANRFLQREIELIRPKYIVSQSTDVAKFVEGMLERTGKRISKKATSEFKTDFPRKYVTTPTFKKFELNGKIITHLRLPHLASGMTNDFWIPSEKQQHKREERLSGLRKELLEFAGN